MIYFSVAMDDLDFHRIARHESLLRLVPDTPGWVETRGMLLAGDGEVFLDAERRDAFVVVSDDGPLASIVGPPSAPTIHRAIENRHDRVEVFVTLEDLENAVAALPGWVVTPVVVHAWKTRVPVAPHEVRFLAREDLPADLPSPLREELERASTWSAIAATIADERAISFCYATAETETLWDVSIDTLEAYRGRGLAAPCVDAMIERLLGRGKKPVWGAFEPNLSSLALARKLGFVPVERKAILTKEPYEYANRTVA